MHALYDSLTAVSFTLQTREFFPRQLAHGSRMNTSAGNKHHFRLRWVTQRALSGRWSPQQQQQQQSNSCSSTTDFLLHVLLQTRCYSGKLRCRTDSRRSARTPVCRSARRLIKLHPAGPPVPRDAAKFRPRWIKSSAAGIAQGLLQRLVSSYAHNALWCNYEVIWYFV